MHATAGRSGAAAALAAIAMALAGASSASAASFPRVAVEPNGTATFAVVSGQQPNANKIVLRRWPFGATLTEPQNVSPAFSSGRPDVAVNDAGQSAVIWVSSASGSDQEVRGRRREADGTFGPVHDLTPAATQGSQPAVAIAPDGSALFVYQRTTPSSAIVARRLSAGGVLGTAKLVSPLNQAVRDPAVAMDGAGNGIVTWSRRNEETDEEFAQARRIAPDGTLGVIKTLAPAAFGVKDTQVGIDGSGRAILAWLEHEGTFYRPRVSVRAANGTYSPVQTILNESPEADGLRLAVNDAGQATLAWLRDYGDGTVVEMRRRAADGTLSSTITMSPVGDDGNSTEPEVAMSPQGHSYVVWQFQAAGSPYAFVQGRRRTAAGALGAIQQHSADERYADSPDVGMDANGHATISWTSKKVGEVSSIAYARRHAYGYLPGPVNPISG